jgi:hypothetical protein
MKMLMLVYSGAGPKRISSLLDRHDVRGYTEFRNVHGAGSTGRREGSRAWPGESTLFVSIVSESASSALLHALEVETTQLPEGERLHVAVLATEAFF